MRLSSFGVIEKGLVESATSDLFATMINLENVYVSLGRLLGEFLQVFAFRVRSVQGWNFNKVWRSFHYVVLI